MFKCHGALFTKIVSLNLAYIIMKTVTVVGSALVFSIQIRWNNANRPRGRYKYGGWQLSELLTVRALAIWQLPHNVLVDPVFKCTLLVLPFGAINQNIIT